MNVNELIAKYTRCVRIQEDEIEETDPFGFGEGYAKGKIRVCKRVLKDLEYLSTIEYSQKSISYDEAIKVVADTYEMTVDDYEHLWAKGNDYLQVDALSKEITGSSLWDHRNCNFDGFEKVEEEPKYYVRFPFSVWNNDSAELDEDYVYLHYDITSDETCFSPSDQPFRDYKPTFTEWHIKNINEDYWPFAVPVEKEGAK